MRMRSSAQLVHRRFTQFLTLLVSCLRGEMAQNKADFEDEFYRKKPKKHDLIILTGGCNQRNLDAVETLLSQGYTNVYNFVGGYDEWERQYNSCITFKDKTAPSCDPSCDNCKGDGAGKGEKECEKQTR